MEPIKLIVKTYHNRYTVLDKSYHKFIINNNNSNFTERLEVYNIIINELINLNEYNSFDEIKYRITDGENPNVVILDVVNRFLDDNYMLWLVKPNIELFIDEDLIKKCS
jgi:hypothetical protein